MNMSLNRDFRPNKKKQNGKQYSSCWDGSLRAVATGSTLLHRFLFWTAGLKGLSTVFISGTLRERGFFTSDVDAEKSKYEHEEFLTSETETYNLPYIESLAKQIAFIKYLPFIQGVKDIKSKGDAVVT